MAIYTMLEGGDWRDASLAEIDTLVSFINSSNANIFIGLGDYLQTDTPEFRARISIPAKWVKGNHDGTVDKWTGLYDFHGIQLLSGGQSSGTSVLNQLDTTKPSMYFQHYQFVKCDNCTDHSGDFDAALRTALETTPKLIGGGCGHAHAYATYFGTDRVLMQSGTQAGIRYCTNCPGNDGWYFGYWEFDDSVNGKLTVKYYRVTVANTFSKSGTPDKTFTIDTAGGGTHLGCNSTTLKCETKSGGGGNTDGCTSIDQSCTGGSGIGWWDGKTCLGSTCIDNKYLAIGGGGIGFLLLLLIKKRKQRTTMYFR